MACQDEVQNHVTLAENNRVGHVSMCGCGTIHLSLGAVSLRISPEVLVEATTMLQQACERLLQQSRALETTSHLIH